MPHALVQTKALIVVGLGMHGMQVSMGKIRQHTEAITKVDFGSLAGSSSSDRVVVDAATVRAWIHDVEWETRRNTLIKLHAGIWCLPYGMCLCLLCALGGGSTVKICCISRQNLLTCPRSASMPWLQHGALREAVQQAMPTYDMMPGSLGTVYKHGVARALGYSEVDYTKAARKHPALATALMAKVSSEAS